MSADCDEAFMILRGETRGTMANIERTCDAKKSCAVAVCEKRGDYVRTLNGEKGFIWLKEYLKRMKELNRID